MRIFAMLVVTSMRFTAERNIGWANVDNMVKITNVMDVVRMMREYSATWVLLWYTVKYINSCTAISAKASPVNANGMPILK
ncbi:MAG: hypothetical protein CMK77_09935 [Pseudomonadales bacterium]|nr:hypothetical protein [Pseudomonadales bacterium]MBT19262.1 hypothetical protein [Candidatus Poribacteria bacterium]